MIRILALLGLVAALTAADWTYTPLVTYEDEAATVVLGPAAAGAWQVRDDHRGDPLGEAVVARDGRVTLTIDPRSLSVVRVQSVEAGGAALTLRFVRPGEGRDLTIDAAGNPMLGGARAVLVLSRLEARADRRWGMLRDASDREPRPCAVALAPPLVSEGVPALTAQVRDAQALAVAGQGVLVELAAADRLAGWKHRAYRQCLAWLVADLQARGATHIALVPPVAAQPLDDDLLPLRRQVADVASAYRCRLVEIESLNDPAGWESAPGVLGTTLNAGGAARRDRLLAPWRR